MGQVAISLKIMPEGPEVDIEKIQAAIAKLVTVKDAKIEPVAFGLKQLRVLVIQPDSTGGTEALEEKIRKIPGVAGVDVDSVTLV